MLVAGVLRCQALAIIRENNPDRNVITGPGEWNATDCLPALELPAEDPHLIVTIHYYRPFAFTHQGASLVKLTNKVDVERTGTDAERGAIRDDFAMAAAWARAHKRPVHLGEFEPTTRLRCIRAFITWIPVPARAEAQGWGWCYWRFGRDFVVYDTRRQAWVEPILRALIPAVFSKSK